MPAPFKKSKFASPPDPSPLDYSPQLTVDGSIRNFIFEAAPDLRENGSLVNINFGNRLSEVETEPVFKIEVGLKPVETANFSRSITEDDFQRESSRGSICGNNRILKQVAPPHSVLIN